MEPRRSLAGAEAAFLRRTTSSKTIVAIPSPYTTGCRLWSAEHSTGAYATRDEFMDACIPIIREEARHLASLGVDAIQIDEPWLALLVDPAFRKRDGITDIDREIELSVKCVNEVADAVEGVPVSVHLCHAHFARKHGTSGPYDIIMGALGEMRVERFAMEFATPDAGGIGVLKDFPDDKVLGLGVIDHTDTHVETPEEVVGRTQAAMRFVSNDRISLNPDCGFAPSSINPMDIDEAYLKLRAMCQGAALLRDKHSLGVRLAAVNSNGRRPAPRFDWFIPIDGDGAHIGTRRAERPPSFEYLRDVVETAEACGFHSMLIPTRFANGLFDESAPLAETWTMATALAAVTSRIRFLVAVRPGFISPGLFGQMAATLDRISGGPAGHQRRTGRDPGRLRAARRVCRSRDPVRAGGRVHSSVPGPVGRAGACRVRRRVRQARRCDGIAGPGRRRAAPLPRRRVARGAAAGRDAVRRIPGLDSAPGRHCAAPGGRGRRVRRGGPDALLRAPYTPGRPADRGRGLGRRHGAHIAGRRGGEELSARPSYAGTPMAGQAAQLREADGHRIGERLWNGISTVRVNCGTALVGTPEQVAEELLAYWKLGIDEFILSGFPHVEECRAGGGGAAARRAGPDRRGKAGLTCPMRRSYPSARSCCSDRSSTPTGRGWPSG